MSDSTLVQAAVGIISTLAAASLLSVFVLLRTMHADIQVNHVLLLEHKDSHLAFERQVQRNTDRLTSVELKAAELRLVQTFYHGNNVANGDLSDKP